MSTRSQQSLQPQLPLLPLSNGCLSVVLGQLGPAGHCLTQLGPAAGLCLT